MTGFPRKGRSYYLDDLSLSVGDLVRCVCDLCGSGFTPGALYKLEAPNQVRDDTGTLVVPSARFQPV